MEAMHFPGDAGNPGFDGLITIDLIVYDHGTEFCRDTVVVRVAPFVMVPVTAPASRVVVSNMDSNFHAAVIGLAGIGNTITPSVNDQWTQDPWEFGTHSDANQFPPLAFETLRAGRPLQTWGRENLRGSTPGDPDRTGIVERLSDTSDGLAHGGNLEVTPPLPNYPLGRIVVGTMPADQKAFLTRQVVQAPLIELDTTWLDVGHIDEFVSIAPVGQTGQWQVIWSDPNLAYALLWSAEPEEPVFYQDSGTYHRAGIATGGTINQLIDTTPGVNFTVGPPWLYVRIYDGTGEHQIAQIIDATPDTLTIGAVWRFNDASQMEEGLRVDVRRFARFGSWFEQPASGSKYLLATGSKLWRMPDLGSGTFVSVPALTTARELRADADPPLKVTNDQAIVRIAEAQSILMPALNGSGALLRTVPGIFLGDPGQIRSMFAYVPGLVNLQAWDGYLWLPKPFGPRFGSVDLFEEAVRQSLPLNDVAFIDDWNTYHRSFGEVHCGTNVIRVPPDEYRRWWENAP